MSRLRSLGLVGFLVVALVALVIVAAGIGQLRIPPAEIVGSILHRLGLDLGPMPAHPQGDNALWKVRFPRVALAVLVGASLATAGALMQGVFGNPLAEPSVVGVSSGAAVGASLVIVTGVNFLGNWTIAAAAFVTGLGTTLLVHSLSRAGGRTEVVTLVLTGIAVNSLAFTLISFATFIANTSAREQLVFWQLGSLNGATWPAVTAVLPFTVVGVVASIILARRLDLLSLGDRSAAHLGVDVERLRLTVIVVVALLVGAGVAFAGIIGFVGLVVPHLIRMIAGPGHRLLLPASALGGAVLTIVADLLARTLIRNADLPIGMITSLVGAPFFFWLLRRTRIRQGGWG
ncbi:iron ABC transporter permease [Kribbella sandramycini]|uniref:Iron ABC transporter permease n=1 Tax=Kribbella sandramycini TaxID=60450 RepID=A0A7Y4P210_9ACTN|nr:iron ABC transporter permease [Kribbella sandramycini]MBB6567135.1 iron complex transport system permease protein [Kribbella sandramycini]NOL44852.1 iron ABC transporter permease [Kribbella sandramycini]